MDGVNRLLAPLLAAALLILGVLVPIEVVRARAGGDGHLLLPFESVARQLRQWTWDDAVVLAISAVVLAVGLALLVGQLRPRRGGLVLLRTEVDGVEAGLRSGSLTSAAADAATEVDGVSGATARLRGALLTVRPVSHLHDVEGLEAAVQAHLRTWVDELDLVRPLEIRARLTQEER